MPGRGEFRCRRRTAVPADAEQETQVLVRHVLEFRGIKIPIRPENETKIHQQIVLGTEAGCTVYDDPNLNADMAIVVTSK